MLTVDHFLNQGRTKQRSRARLTSLCAILCGLACASSAAYYGQPMKLPFVAVKPNSPLFPLGPGVAQEPMAQPAVADKQNQDDREQMRKTIKRLTAEIERLRRRVSEFEQTNNLNSIRDRLTKEELRAEDLQSQQVAIAEKEANLQFRMDEVNIQLRPENIEQLQMAGSLRPEQVRETTRRRLASEKLRIQSQLDLLQQNRTRLQSSLSVTDLIIQRLRGKLQSLARP
jgi:predicted ribosome quality control (RQC) complex YloA/Tae2 family protein